MEKNDIENMVDKLREANEFLKQYREAYGIKNQTDEERNQLREFRKVKARIERTIIGELKKSKDIELINKANSILMPYYRDEISKDTFESNNLAFFTKFQTSLLDYENMDVDIIREKYIVALDGRFSIANQNPHLIYREANSSEYVEILENIRNPHILLDVIANSRIPNYAIRELCDNYSSQGLIDCFDKIENLKLGIAGYQRANYMMTNMLIEPGDDWVDFYDIIDNELAEEIEAKGLKLSDDAMYDIAFGQKYNIGLGGSVTKVESLEMLAERKTELKDMSKEEIAKMIFKQLLSKVKEREQETEFSPNQIGKATINVPKEAMKAAKQVENTENTREGEEARDDN